MRTIKAEEIVDAVALMAMESNYYLDPDALEAFKKARKTESSARGRDILDQILENSDLAAKEKIPTCQDTGIAVVFADVGEDVFIEGSMLNAVQDGIEKGYKDGYLRMSICDPITRENTKTNTPAVVHITEVPGDKLTLTFGAKGGGSEGQSLIKVLKPADGLDGIVDFVVQRVSEGGSSACPPLTIGIGIGGTIERAGIIAKRAIFRKLGEPNPRKDVAELEQRILKKLNDLGLGPMGWGGDTTAIGVHCEVEPCHIANLPVAINIQCHAARHKEVVL